MFADPVNSFGLMSIYILWMDGWNAIKNGPISISCCPINHATHNIRLHLLTGDIVVGFRARGDFSYRQSVKLVKLDVQSGMGDVWNDCIEIFTYKIKL